MLAKKTSKNQITLPKKIISRFPGVEYFDVTEDRGRIILMPVQQNKADLVRDKLAEMGIVAEDISAALDWSRRK
ncbi:MAG: AbrB/MazE/SpoVT family DNA-binding domain-containing protein [Geothermobacteraceae bacterium]